MVVVLIMLKAVQFSSVLEFVCLPWSEVCSARVTSLLLLLLLLLLLKQYSITVSHGDHFPNKIGHILDWGWPERYTPRLPVGACGQEQGRPMASTSMSSSGLHARQGLKVALGEGNFRQRT